MVASAMPRAVGHGVGHAPMLIFMRVTVCKDKKLAADVKEHFAATVAEGKRFFDPPRLVAANWRPVATEVDEEEDEEATEGEEEEEDEQSPTR